MLLVSLAVYAVSFVLLRLLSRYRELAADRAGAYLTMRPDALASALQKITGGINQIPQRDLRQVGAASALCIAPAISGVSLRTLTSTHPSLEQRLEQLARIQAELSRPSPEADLHVGLWETITGRSRPKRANLDSLFLVPSAAITLQTAAGLTPDRRRLGLLPGGHRCGVPRDPGRHRGAAGGRRGRPAGPDQHRRVRLHLAAGAPGARRPEAWPGCAPTCTRSTPRWRPRGSAPGCSAR